MEQHPGLNPFQEGNHNLFQPNPFIEAPFNAPPPQGTRWNWRRDMATTKQRRDLGWYDEKWERNTYKNETLP